MPLSTDLHDLVRGYGPSSQRIDCDISNICSSGVESTLISLIHVDAVVESDRSALTDQPACSLTLHCRLGPSMLID